MDSYYYAEMAAGVAQTILDGFDKRYRLFREISTQAKARFEQAEWALALSASRVQIDTYDQCVAESVLLVRRRYPQARENESLWPLIKLAYIRLLYDHLQPDCAETFYNSVACRVLHRAYYNNEHLFWRPAVSTEHLTGEEPAYRCYYPATCGLRRTLRAILLSFGLKNPFADLRRDLRHVLRAVREFLPQPREVHPNLQIHVLSSLFYRNKAAYLLGLVQNGNSEHPFAIPILQNEQGELYLDALLLKREHIGALFSLARAYFMVDMEVPSAYVAFLSRMMPGKPKAELYIALGLQKQGKTLFYRDLHEHLKHSTDRFVIAPGVRGMVMLVFTLPSFPYVFKIIRDRFEPPKEVSEREVKDKYLLVKYHDRVGRMADTLEYSQVAFPLGRFDPALLGELRRLCGGGIELDKEQIVIKHLYIERRMVPLDVYLKDADPQRLRMGILEYGHAIREMAAANIFPGDLLLKNFGVTRFGRVVFYDYDEICYLTECKFRHIPPPRSFEDEMSGEPWYSVGPRDVFPEEFPTFLFPPGRARDLFLQHHGDLTDPDFWIERQRRILAGIQEDVFPYPAEVRFRHRF